MNNTGKLKFKKENDKPKLRDSLIFVLIFILCIVTVVTIQMRSQQKNDAKTLNSQRVQHTQSTDEKSAPAAAKPLEEDNIQSMQEANRLQQNAVKTANILPDIKESSANENKKDVIDNEINDNEPSKSEQKENELNFVKPLDGAVYKKFAEKELLYSKTMDDWRVHLGIDIAAPIGTKVVSCEAGTVEEVIDDEQYGTTVVIRHNDRYATRYSNLADSFSVGVGKNVKKGEQIGVVGDTAMYEVLDDAHLHFAISDNGVYVNPTKYINFK